MFEEELKKAGDGDKGALERICRETWKPLYGFIYYKVQNRQEAEDIVQETYIKALSHSLKKSVDLDKYIAFLKTVSLNILRDRWRKAKRKGKTVNIEAVNPAEISMVDPQEAGVEKERIKKALESLSEEQRMVVILRIVKGYSAAETAGIMNKSEGNIRVIQYRALKNLADYLESYDARGRD